MNLRDRLKTFLSPPVVKKTIRLIRLAETLGLPKGDVENADELIDHNEWGEAFDTVVVQMHEFDIAITEEFRELAKEIIADLKIDENEYAFIEELSLKE